MLEMPRIRIELESMKYEVVHAFLKHNDEIEQFVEKELNRVIAEYPFMEQVTRIANQVIADAVKDCLTNYFRYGDGKEMIETVIKSALARLPAAMQKEG